MRYHNITSDDMLNGDGLRVVLWVSGCEHHCKGCQNPVTRDINDGLIFDSAAENEIFSELEKDYISGLTLSGGDPLHPKNRADVERLAKTVREKYPEKNIWLYTGYDWDEIKSLPVMKYIDVVVDGEYIEEQRDINLPWRGSANQRVIDVKNSIKSDKIILFA